MTRPGEACAAALASDLVSIATAAYFGDQRDTAEKAFRLATEAGNTSAMSNLGMVLRESGRVEEAEQWFSRAADTE